MGTASFTQTSWPDDNRRYHSLDQLRAVMMLLGLVIHSSASFGTIPLGAAWRYKDTETSLLFDILTFFIHVFRMPLFFLMAGFFLAFLYYRRGELEMLKNRAARLAGPFALFLAVLFPLTYAGFVFSASGGVHGGWGVARAYLAHPSGWYENLTTIHLWFLYYLILYSAAVAVFMPLVERITGSWTDTIGPRLGRLIHHPLGILLGITVTCLTLLPMAKPGLDTEIGFLVQPKILLAYGVFMGFGWVLYLNRNQVDRFADRAWHYIVTGFLLSSAYLALSVTTGGAYPIATKTLAASAMWTLIYGFIGLFVRYFDHPKPLGRYLSDASYWLYLVHLPVTIWVPGLMNGWGIPAAAKAGITFLAAVAFSIVTYHYCVRSTAIGVLLNGKRYERRLPLVREQAPQAAVQTA